MEITSSTIQSVGANQNVLFTEEPIAGSKCIQHRSGSGLVTLRGITNQCNARFLIQFGGNIAIPTDGTVSDINMAIAISGEPIQSTVMTVTPAAVNNYFNVSSSVYINVPRGCCTTVSIENISTQAISVNNANLIVTRVA